MTRLLIIGGSDAGIAAALRAREVDSTAEVTVVVADHFPNYSICGLPFYLSGEVPDWHSLAHRTIPEITGHGITLLMDRVARLIDPGQKVVTVVDHDGRTDELPYDRLIVATGAEPVRPPIAGLDLPRVYVLHTMEDSFAVHDDLQRTQPRSAVIIGGGYIGLEMADALTHRGVTVNLAEQLPTVMPTVDQSIGQGLRMELERHAVTVTTGVTVQTIEQEGPRLVVNGSPAYRATGDLVLVVVGVRPNSELAKTAGIALGDRGAIRVTRGMETNVPDVYAAGDCVETWHRLLQRPTYIPLGTTAHKQGRVAGENAVGGQRLFEGSLGTQVVKVFDLAVVGTGLRDESAREAGFDPLTVETIVPDHKIYYPGAHDLRIRVTGDWQTGRLLGAQILGSWKGEVAKRIDIVAAALFHGMTIDGISDLDLSYTPPVSAPWDPIQVAAQAWVLEATTRSVSA